LGAVEAYFSAVEAALKQAGYEGDEYGQASLFVTLKSESYSLLWKASDGNERSPVRHAHGPSEQITVDGNHLRRGSRRRR